ncbi:unnamed protein product [Clonostachys rhizophaga]|uniref:Ubiquitin carboxyl-terminal hydrolase n=1 Tax=Clonostachys rhizophaga TaxID=160324 RepID=A0A9N9V6N8_9HYPO|nr:unnamed protein product [Clonostachys rhizophaga]
MQNRPATVVSYAAGASLAAVALIYVFGPTFTLDDDANSSRKKTIVGLRNQANDCFINSVLQVLAGLDDLRIYLIRETHRRRIENPGVYTFVVQPDGKKVPEWKLQGLQEGLVTQGLKEMLDALNERPIYKKSISPFPIVRVLEMAFRQKISRQQQDAQEFLQIVAERLKDEYHAGRRARMHTRRYGLTPSPSTVELKTAAEKNGSNAASGTEGESEGDEKAGTEEQPKTTNGSSSNSSIETPGDEPASIPLELEDNFPMEGKYESQLQCLTCRYKSKPREETFCTLTLAVPQVSSTSLNSCFDGIFKTEHIDDFKCENCRLLQTRTNLEHDMAKSTSETFKAQAKESIDKLTEAIETDPERPPEDVELSDIRFAPKRRIAKTTRMTTFPKILALHLSRSIYGVGQMTQKNSAKVSFPEHLSLGGLAQQHKYKLLGVVTHRGGHNSGHYEAFRRQNQPRPPFANINTFQPSEVYSKTPTPAATPKIQAKRVAASPAVSTPDLLSSSSLNNSSTPSLESMVAAAPRSIPQEPALAVAVNGKDGSDKEKDGDSSSIRSAMASTKSALSRIASPKSKDDGGLLSPKSGIQPPRRRKHGPEKWWRVSDEKVRESKTSEVLGMQKEVYLLFYELEK